jgi:epoxyqueuosine reductase
MTDSNPSTDKSPDPVAAVTLETIRQWGQEMGFQALGFTGIDLAQHQRLPRQVAGGGLPRARWTGWRATVIKRRSSGSAGAGDQHRDHRTNGLPARGRRPRDRVWPPSDKAYISRYALGSGLSQAHARPAWPSWPNGLKRELGRGQYRAFVDSAPVYWNAPWPRTPGWAGSARTPCC